MLMHRIAKALFRLLQEDSQFVDRKLKLKHLPFRNRVLTPGLNRFHFAVIYIPLMLELVSLSLSIDHSRLSIDD